MIFTIEDILLAVPGSCLIQGEIYEVKHLACHTDEIRQGESIFAAVRGGGDWYEKPFDHHRHINRAIENGAQGLLVERYDEALKILNKNILIIKVPNVIYALGLLTSYLIKKNRIQVTAVTGSTGKTTACEIIATVLQEEYQTIKFISDRATPISVPRTLLNSGLEQYQKLVTEMPMDGLGQIKKLCEITPPNIGIVININNSHIEQLETIENIVEAKAELLKALPNKGTAVLNYDDEKVKSMSKFTNANVLGVGLAKNVGVRASNVNLSMAGVSFDLSYHSETVSTKISVPLSSVITSALLGAGAGIVADMPLESISRGIANFKSLPGRMELLRGKENFWLLDDSRLATPESTKFLIHELLKIDIRPNKKILVEGAVLRPEQHGVLDERTLQAISVLDAVYFVGSGTIGYYETLRVIGRNDIYWAESHEEAAQGILALAQPNDFVAVNGSENAEMSKIIPLLIDRDQTSRTINEVKKN